MKYGATDKSKLLYRSMVVLYLIFSFCTAAIYGVKRDLYHLFITLGTMLIPLGIWSLPKMLKLKREYFLDLIVLGFAFLAYTLGSCVDLYKILPGFDKLAHMLSGVFAGMLALCLYCVLKGECRPRASDCAIVVLFVFFGSMAAAGMWEIGEYFVHMITGRDVQKVIATGINDTMLDMIVCMIGTIMYLPSVKRFCSGKCSILNNAVGAFAKKNENRMKCGHCSEN